MCLFEQKSPAPITGSHPRFSAWSWYLGCGEPGPPGTGVLLGVIREAGELERGSLLVTAGPSSVGSVEQDILKMYPTKLFLQITQQA